MAQFPINVGGREWKLRFTGKIATWGWCVYKDRELLLHSKARGGRLQDTIIHEMTHAHFPDAAESQVRAFATEVSRVLNLPEIRRRIHGEN